MFSLRLYSFRPQLFGIQTYGILTGSMEPAIQTGALTFVDTGVSGADLRPGDVAAFDIGEGRICTHRVVSVDPENQTITATGYGIQSEGLPDIETAWDAYKKQNGIGDGAKGELYAITLSGSSPDEAHLVFARMSEEPSVGDTYDTQQILQVVKEPETTSKLTSYGSKIKSVTTIDPVVPTTMKSCFTE